MARYQFDVAGPDNDRQLRELLRASPTDGRIQLTFQREPNYFAAVPTLGPFCQTLICREMESQAIVAVASRSIRDVFVNGQPQAIGYLGMLRIIKGHQNSSVLARGYRFLRQLHRDDRTPMYYTTIADGNQRAINTLTSGRAGLPAYHPAGVYHTLAIGLSTRAARAESIDRWKPANGLEIRRATDEDLSTIVDYVNRVGSSYQFFPVCRESDFSAEAGANPGACFNGLSASDFFIALRDGQLVGTIGAWDQHAIRQTVVHGYSAALKFSRPLYNVVARLRGRSRLPLPGQPFRYLIATLTAIERNDPFVFRSLINALNDYYSGGDYDFLMMGLHETNPLLETVGSRATLQYKTQVYHVCWPDGESFRRSLDDRPPWYELGCL
jgi:hypothetical protein